MIMKMMSNESQNELVFYLVMESFEASRDQSTGPPDDAYTFMKYVSIMVHNVDEVIVPFPSLAAVV